MGFPGVRGVLTCGDRFDYEYTNTAFDVVEKNEQSHTTLESFR